MGQDATNFQIAERSMLSVKKSHTDTSIAAACAISAAASSSAAAASERAFAASAVRDLDTVTTQRKPRAVFSENRKFNTEYR
jgi:hypothetical protein